MFKISLRKIFWRLYELFPDEIRFSLIRNSMKIRAESVKEFRFKVATTRDEIEQGFHLLYQCYKEAGLMTPNPEQLRITKYHLLPTSTMIVGMKGSEVVATVTHVLDSYFGLPCEKQVDLSEVREKSTRVAEISALAVKRGYRRNHSLLFALTRYLYFYATEVARVSHWVICIRSNIKDYYKAIFFFNELTNKSFKCDFVNGKESVVLKADLKILPTLFSTYYGLKADEKNLFRFYMDPEKNKIEVRPALSYSTSTLPTMNREMIEYFFREKSNILNALSDAEKREVLNAYFEKDFEKLFESEKIKNSEQRKFPRRTVSLTGHYVLALDSVDHIFPIFILNVSSMGLLMYSDRQFEANEKIQVYIEIRAGQRLKLEIEILRANTPKRYSCRVASENHSAWKNYIDGIEESIQKMSQDSFHNDLLTAKERNREVK